MNTGSVTGAMSTIFKHTRKAFCRMKTERGNAESVILLLVQLAPVTRLQDQIGFPCKWQRNVQYPRNVHFGNQGRRNHARLWYRHTSDCDCEGNIVNK